MDAQAHLYLYDRCEYCSAFLWLWAGVKGAVIVECDSGHRYKIPIREAA